MMLLPSPPSLADRHVGGGADARRTSKFGARTRDYVFCVETEFHLDGAQRAAARVLPAAARPRRRCTAILQRDPRRPDAVTRALASERDRDMLRSFARRIDPSDAGRAQQPRRALLQQGAVRGGGRRVHARRSSSTRKMQVAQRNLEIAYFNTGLLRQAHRRAARAAAPAPRTTATRAGSWAAPTRCSGQSDEAVAEFTALLAAPSQRPRRARAARRSPRSDAATSARRSTGSSARCALDPGELGDRSSTSARCCYNQGLQRRGARGARARRSSSTRTTPTRTTCSASCYGDMGRHEEARAASKRAVAAQPGARRARRRTSRSTSTTRTSTPELGAGRTSGARSALMQVAEGSELAHYNLGLAFRQKGYYAEALREYRLALERGEDRATRAARRWPRCTCCGRTSAAAIALYDELLRRASPTSPKLWNERGVALHQDGRLARGAESYRQALAGRPALRARAQQPRRGAATTRGERERRGGRVPRRAAAPSRRS